MKITVFLFAFFFIQPCFAQDERLTPVDSSWKINNRHPNYIDSLEKGFTNKSILRFYVRPSFGAAFSLEKKDSLTYILVSNSMGYKYHFYFTVRHIQTVSKAKIISKELATLIDTLFDIVTQEKNTTGEPGIGLDGINYYLLHFDPMKKSFDIGKTWSPNPKSKMAELVNFCEDILSFSKTTFTNEKQLLEKGKIVLKSLN